MSKVKKKVIFYIIDETEILMNTYTVMFLSLITYKR